MKKLLQITVAALAAGAMWAAPVRAQDPVSSTPIVVKQSKQRSPKWSKFEGTVMNANIAQITVRAKENDLSIQTFPLSDAASAKMQQIIDKGGYQYGDRVTVLYDPQTRKAAKIKGKPSRPL